MSKTDITRFLPDDQYQAAINADSPSALNPFATIGDTLYGADGTVGAGRIATLTDSLTFSGGTTIHSFTSGGSTVQSGTGQNTVGFGVFGSLEYLSPFGSDWDYFAGGYEFAGNPVYGMEIYDNTTFLEKSGIYSYIANWSGTDRPFTGMFYTADGANFTGIEANPFGTRVLDQIPLNKLSALNAADGIAFLSGVGGNGYIGAANQTGFASWIGSTLDPPLTDVLTVGNTTANGQTIEALNGGGYINLREGGDNVVFIDNNSGGFGNDGLYLDNGYGALFFGGWNGAYEGTANYLASYVGDSLNAQRADVNAFFTNTKGFFMVSHKLNAFSTNPNDGDFGPSVTAIINAANTTVQANAGVGIAARNNVIVGGDNHTLVTGVDNTVILGGNTTTAGQSNTAYVTQIAHYNSAPGLDTTLIFEGATTGAKTQRFQDQSGDIMVGPQFNNLVANPTVAQDGFVIGWDDVAGEYVLVDSSGFGFSETSTNGGSATNAANRTRLNFIEGTGMDVTAVDNPGSDRVDITITNQANWGQTLANGNLSGDNAAILNATLADDRQLRTASGVGTRAGLQYYTAAETGTTIDGFYLYTGDLVSRTNPSARIYADGNGLSLTWRLIDTGLDFNDTSTRLFTRVAELELENSFNDTFKFIHSAAAGDFTFAFTSPTADRTVTFQDASGTVAYLSDIPAGGFEYIKTNAGGDTNAAIRRNINFVDSLSVSPSATDNPGTDSVDVSFSVVLGWDDVLLNDANSGATDPILSTSAGVPRELKSAGAVNEWAGLRFYDKADINNITDAFELYAGNPGSKAVGSAQIYGDDASLSLAYNTNDAQLYLSAFGAQLGANVGEVTLYSFAQDRFQFQDSNSQAHNLSFAGTTAARTYTYQDADGTLAFLTDIPAGAGDNIYNTDGALTANRTITGAFDLNINNGGAFRRTGNFVFAEGAVREIRVEQSTGLAGYDLTVAAGAAADGLGTGGDLYLEPGAGGTTPGGSAGDIWIRGLAGNGNGTGSTINITSGLSPNNSGGDIVVTTGNGGGPGAGGDFTVTTGTGAARGSIIFVDGSEGTIGDVWTSSGVGGQGTWSTPARVATGQSYTVNNEVATRTFDANSTTLNEIADVLGTLIEDLKTTDILN